jgi:predicted naringenin-chalcone synthase
LFDPAAIKEPPKPFAQVSTDAFAKGLALANQATRACFEKKTSDQDHGFPHLSAQDIDAVLGGSELAFGLSPDMFIHTQAPFRSDILRLGFTRGFGCVGSATSLANAHRHLIAHPKHALQILHVDAYSSQFEYGYQQLLSNQDDPLHSNKELVRNLLVPAILLGDAAAAATLVGSKHPAFESLVYEHGQPAIIDSESFSLDGRRTEEPLMGYHTRGWGPMVYLTQDIPVAGSMAIQIALDRLLKRYGLGAKDISHWSMHPGGSPVLRLLQNPVAERKEQLHLSQFKNTFREVAFDPEQLAASWHVLKNYGNCISPTLLMVLERTLDTIPCAKYPEFLIAAGVGPGLTACVVLMKRFPKPQNKEDPSEDQLL